MIAFDAVSKRYARWRSARIVDALAGFTLTVRRGEVLGIAGPNGAGKSTLIGILLGYLRPTSGTVTIDGQAPRAYIERHGIGYLSELVDVEPRWTVGEALERFATLAGVRDAEVALRAQEVAERFGLADQRGARFRELSKGNKQRLGLAQALLRQERVLVLDEPTHGLDPLWTNRFRAVVAELRRPDRAVLVASHNLEELERLCDRVAILDRGQLQRVVDVTRVMPMTRASLWRLTVAAGAEQLADVFGEVVPLGRGDWAVRAAGLPELNAKLARALACGVLLSGVAPAQSALEHEFHEAVGDVLHEVAL
ncbi:ABC transporter ATP-binding protein [Gemmatimonadetes bacterium T265]|nr:ABC transporter ATP-binding protein [Gemmatimonadetes bacterium T265]